MSFSKETIALLENFASINQGLVFKPGNKIRTISILKNVFAVAEIPDEITRDFAVYDLRELLATLSLFKSPDVDFKNDHILITEGKSRVKYFYSSPAVVVSPPDKDITLNNPELSFTLTKENFAQIKQAAATLKLKHLSINQGKLTALNIDGVGNQITIDLETEGDLSEERIVKIENLKLIDGSYDVEVYSTALKFTSQEKEGLVYLVTVGAK